MYQGSLCWKPCSKYSSKSKCFPLGNSIGSQALSIIFGVSYTEAHLPCPSHCSLPTFCRHAVRKAPTCMTMACCCLVELTSSEGWSLCVARWLKKVTILIQLMQKRMTQMSGGAEPTQTMQMAGKRVLMWSCLIDAETSCI